MELKREAFPVALIGTSFLFYKFSLAVANINLIRFN